VYGVRNWDKDELRIAFPVLDRIHIQNVLLLLLYNIYIAHYITITLSASHYKTIKIIQDTN
jgi:hypothetical protein